MVPQMTEQDEKGRQGRASEAHRSPSQPLRLSPETLKAHCGRSSADQRVDLVPKFSRHVDDIAAAADERSRHALPGRGWAVDEVVIPHGRPRMGDMLIEPCAHKELGIPVVDHPRVVQHLGVPCTGRVTAENRLPYRVDVDICLRILHQDLVLHPTGARVANGSGGGKEQEQAGAPGVSVELPLEHGYGGDLVQARRRSCLSSVISARGSHHGYQEEGQGTAREPNPVPNHSIQILAQLSRFRGRPGPCPFSLRDLGLTVGWRGSLIQAWDCMCLEDLTTGGRGQPDETAFFSRAVATIPLISRSPLPPLGGGTARQWRSWA
jgi:hypothetical protein